MERQRLIIGPIRKRPFRYCIPGQSYKLVSWKLSSRDETRKQSARAASVPRREKGSRRFISSPPSMENEQKFYIYI